MPLTERQTVFATAVMQQLGGNQFIRITGSTNFVVGDDVLTFKVGSGAAKGIKYVKITLTPMDVYKVEFVKVKRDLTLVVVACHEMVYDDMLQDIFTAETGFYTHF
jgi:spore coat polysaccharide biosynthesis protein SpsF (cytidylyltransferase family)